MEIEEIQESIKEGLKKGYKQNLLLLSSYNDFIGQVREYLLTVNVAQSLLEWNVNNHYKIQIEYSVLNFYSNAFPSYKIEMSDLFEMGIISRKSENSPTNKNYQKIDIAITTDINGNQGSSHERTIVGVELKGINKNIEDIRKDAVRLAKAMVLKDNTDDNSIKFSFCGFLKRLDKAKEIVDDATIKKLNEVEKHLWQKICDELNLQFPDLEFSIDIFNIVNTAYEVVAEIHKEIESDYSEVALSTGTVSGGLITINRK